MSPYFGTALDLSMRIRSRSVESTVRARWFVVATGSRPAVPKIAGLDRSKIYTNENIFELRDKPDHLVIVGGGPIGIEMALPIVDWAFR